MSFVVKSLLSSGRTLRTAQELIEAGLVPLEKRGDLNIVAQRYAIAIPPDFLALIEHPDDPIAMQVVPSVQELTITQAERSDPIGDETFSPVPGIVHRYADRALLKPLLVCPLYCRFCFRREHVGPDGGILNDADLNIALEWLRTHPQIREVILTGGDPLILSPRRLAMIMQTLENIEHITTIRIHTRVPVAVPDYITESLLEALESKKAVWMVIHINHERELSDKARRSVKRVIQRGIPLLGQSVLLRGVNDTEQALENLFRSMVENRIRPYYLHHLDRAPGTERFYVSMQEGLHLLSRLRGRVTGLAWPLYTLDIPGGYGKIPLGPNYVDSHSRVRDPSGQLHNLEHL